MKSPPRHVILAAENAAAGPGCMGSHRGVAIFHPKDRQQSVIATGRNGQPEPFACDGGSVRCREVCGKRCVHAERRALNELLSMLGGSIPQIDRDPSDLDLVHVKLGPDSQVIAGGGPSCWQCSREILDVGIGGVWLYQTPESTRDLFIGDISSGAVRFESCSQEVADHRRIVHRERMPQWVRYSAEAFHRITLRNCGLEGP